LGDGIIKVLCIKDNSTALGSSHINTLDAEVITYSQRYACPDHPDELIPELEPRLFSFNQPQAACPVCTGLGTRMEIDPELVLNPNLTIAEGGIRPYNRVNQDAWWLKRLQAVGERHGFSVRTPIRELSDEHIQMILYGTGDEKYHVKLNSGYDYDAVYEGVIPNLERRYKETE
jgi:excinuclease ABC subunit A